MNKETHWGPGPGMPKPAAGGRMRERGDAASEGLSALRPPSTRGWPGHPRGEPSGQPLPRPGPRPQHLMAQCLRIPRFGPGKLRSLGHIPTAPAAEPRGYTC